eukprot:6200211-Pleurochrysis_carterae.AAC.9
MPQHLSDQALLSAQRCVLQQRCVCRCPQDSRPVALRTDLLQCEGGQECARGPIGRVREETLFIWPQLWSTQKYEQDLDELRAPGAGALSSMNT